MTVRCALGFHRWRLGTPLEYPRGFIGCARCGRLRRFDDLFRPRWWWLW